MTACGLAEAPPDPEPTADPNGPETGVLTVIDGLPVRRFKKLPELTIRDRMTFRLSA